MINPNHIHTQVGPYTVMLPVKCAQGTGLYYVVVKLGNVNAEDVFVSHATRAQVAITDAFEYLRSIGR